MNIFNEIEDLRDLGVAADNKYFEQQLFKFGFISSKTQENLCMTSKFGMDYQKQQELGDSFKTHFEVAHIIIKKVRSKTMQSSAFH